MRAAVLFRGVEFGGAFVEFADVEQRIVAEAAFAARRAQDFAVPFAFGDDRLRVVRVADKMITAT